MDVAHGGSRVESIESRGSIALRTPGYYGTSYHSTLVRSSSLSTYDVLILRSTVRCTFRMNTTGLVFLLNADDFDPTCPDGETSQIKIIILVVLFKKDFEFDIHYDKIVL